jgi:hypothetical protein
MAQIVSDTPGRLRVRLLEERRHQQFMQEIEARAARHDGVSRVRTNAGTGSVTISYDPTRQRLEEVLAMLADLGVVAQSVMTEEPPQIAPRGASTTAETILDALDDLDRRLSELTGRKVDLKLAFPLSLGALGVYQLVRNGLQLDRVPAYVLLWYAFDSFYKLHVNTRPTTPLSPQRPAFSVGSSQVASPSQAGGRA